MGVAANADFTRPAGKIRPALHSSGWSPRSYPRAVQNDDEAVKALGMAYARTHDWALVNSGQRVVDYQYVFPLIDKDPADPANYFFAATDHLLRLSRAVGLKTFYRLGTSIEHTGLVHFNAEMPKDFDKVAEVFAATVRHYNRGWANGRKWGIRYWEIWNEPDGIRNMWCVSGKGYSDRFADYMRRRFIEFFVVCLRRLKAEFPEIKVGGPALCFYREGYFRELLEACRAAGVAPDFLSWHYYGDDPGAMPETAARARRLCDECGFPKCELILDEWHYVDTHAAPDKDAAARRRRVFGPTGWNQSDSAAFTLACLARFQTSALAQAYFYGCGATGRYGYMDEFGTFNKVWHACRLFGGIVKGYSRLFPSESAAPGVTTLAVGGADGKRAGLLVVSYRGPDRKLAVDVAGLPESARASAVLLDEAHDGAPCEVGWREGRLTLAKPDKGSAAFWVEFA